MTRLTDKKLLYGIMAIIAVITITSYASMDKSLQAQGLSTTGNMTFQPGITMKGKMAPDNFIAQGGNSAVKVDIPINNVTLTKGTSVDVDIHIKHIAGVNPSSFVNVKLIQPAGIYYPPSVSNSTTPAQRMNVFETGKLIPGSLDISRLVSFSEVNPIKISANSEHVVKMHISIPQDVPSEVIGNEIFLNIPIQVTDSNGNADTVASENGGITILVR